MANIRKYTVVPRLPERIGKLLDIANNLWWCWDPEAIDLFFRINRDLWVQSGQNPRHLLGLVGQVRLEELAEDDSFLAHLDRVYARLAQYTTHSNWRERNPDAGTDFLVGYFSAEYGIHESIKIYSGGLGVLAGDHLKAASDLGLPLVGVGLLYRGGYFSQYLNMDGWQQEMYPHNDFYNMPIEHCTDSTGAPLVIQVPYPNRQVKAKVWKCQVGRVPLYLLDCDHEDNSTEDRSITGQLYGGDRETRVRQEVMLGMGGVIALHALGIRPTCYHMNEGHSAFMALQRIKDLVLHEKMPFHQALEMVKACSVFTTHTPVPAGNDMFEPVLIQQYFKHYCDEVGISIDELLALGRQEPSDARETFCMTVLALKLSAVANGVSRLHGEVARNMWQLTWKGVPEEEVPITSITNGVHTRSYISRDLSELYDRYLGPGWVDSPDDQTIWKHVDEIPDTEFWRTHERRRDRLVNFARRRLHAQYLNRGAAHSKLAQAMEVLDPEILTIGFARRFATYKRADLILRDPERLRKILLSSDRPVQFIIAGKAHPQDNAGKQLIRDLVHFGRDPEVRKRFVFIEDYNINVARYMVQGVDCWLNTPRRPMEASGTSGMKASANGALNISIPDGWWCEAEELGPVGWSIGKGERYDTIEEQDDIESRALYDLLEQEVIPMFYDRGKDNLPRVWIRRMKAAIHHIVPVFNTYRMVQEYTERCYTPCSERRLRFKENKRARAKALADWKQKVRSAWSEVRIEKVESDSTHALPYGAELPVTADIRLGGLTNQDVIAELYYGVLDRDGQISNGNTVEMEFVTSPEDGLCRFQGAVPCKTTGQLGFTVRIIPNHEDLAKKHETRLICWS